MHAMDCTTFDDRLADYLEGDLTPADVRQVETHLSTCVRCTALVRDLERIRAGATELPELTPSADLWNGIARRIETPVVQFETRPAPNAAPLPARRHLDRLRTAAIAAALVAVTAGVTYTLTISRDSVRSGGSQIAVIAQPPLTSGSTTAPAAMDSARNDTVAPVADLATEPETSPGGRQATTQSVRNVPASVTYSREIDRLRVIFQQSRSQLDPRTAAIIETNLKVIDDAIAQSKAALAHDPASRFLTDQLNSALDKKLELLRTAALLPNRT
jgi:anti-sigma factor RsiW